jgi:hypothetical protein
MNWLLPVTGLVAQPTAVPAADMDRSHKKCRRVNEGSCLSNKEISFMPPPSVTFESGILHFYHKTAHKKRKKVPVPRAEGFAISFLRPAVIE